jgi:PleD family two-component response regulator
MNKRIISVNGHKAMNYLLQTIFENEFEFIPVTDAYQALHHINKYFSIEAVIVDVDFQPQQNWELIEHIKSSRLLKIPVVLLSSENNENIQQRCMDLEIDEIFFKPFNPVELITAIKSIAAGPLVSA